MKTVFELKTLAKERCLHGYSRLTWKHRLLLKFGCHQLNVYNGTFRQQFIKTFLNSFSLSNVRQDVLNSVYYHVDEESQRAIDTELFSRYL